MDFLRLAHKEIVTLGHYVESYSNPSIAHTEIRKNPNKYNKIIIDQTMPEISGDQLAEMIRGNNNFVDLCILTARLENVPSKFSAKYQAIKKPCKMINLVGPASDEHTQLNKKAA
jgi:DNA-binding response OmpR family regulator